MRLPEITEIEIRLSSPEREGADDRLFGWASFVVAGVLKVCDAIILRETDGRLSLRWPQLRSLKGRPYSVVHPISKRFARAVEAAVLGQLQQSAESSKQHKDRES